MEQSIFYWLNQLPTSARRKAKAFGIANYRSKGAKIKNLTAPSMYIAMVYTGVMSTPQRGYWNRVIDTYEAKSHPKNEAAV